MQRKAKFLSYALALATLSLFCLEAVRAEPSPSAPNELTINLTELTMGYKLTLQLNPVGDLLGVKILGPLEDRTFSIQQIRQGRFSEVIDRHKFIQILVDPGFNALSGGGITIKYLTHADEGNSSNDVFADYPMTLTRTGTTGWSFSKGTSMDHPLRKISMHIEFCDFQPCALSRITP